MKSHYKLKINKDAEIIRMINLTTLEIVSLKLAVIRHNGRGLGKSQPFLHS